MTTRQKKVVITAEETEAHDAPMTDAMAEHHDKVLAVVRQLLKAEGVRSYIVHTIALKLSENGEPWALGQRTRRTPHLIAHNLDGGEVANVTVGSRSGCYLVSLPSVGITAQPVNADQPHAVVDMILATTPKGSARRVTAMALGFVARPLEFPRLRRP